MTAPRPPKPGEAWEWYYGTRAAGWTPVTVVGRPRVASRIDSHGDGTPVVAYCTFDEWGSGVVSVMTAGEMVAGKWRRRSRPPRRGKAGR